ncbi:MAG: hypothetical protein GY701_17135 [Sulfitobacter sp.]|nr:hypothetical protein [Sulfitobacter sp.]
MTVTSVACTGSSDSAEVTPTSAVSRQAYDQAFEEFQSCVSENGGTLLSVETNTQFGTYEYSYQDADSVTIEDCYNRKFMEAQIGFESSNVAIRSADKLENEREWNTQVLPCLARSGLDVPSTLSEAENQLSASEIRDLYQIYIADLADSAACDEASAE